jgi:hypothetical protein
MYKHRTIAGIPAAEILRLRPGDILALSYPVALAHEDAEQIMRDLHENMPPEVKVAVIDRDARFQIIRTGKDETG